MPAPSAGPNDVTTDAVGHADDDDADESETADGDPAFCDPCRTGCVPGSVPTRSCCSPRRSWPAPVPMGPRGVHGRCMLVGCELHDLVGDVTSRRHGC
jgi:hypothetical protein